MVMTLVDPVFLGTIIETSMEFNVLCYVCEWISQSKLKKIQDKYGDQDEEERQLRLEILAVSRFPYFR